MPDPAAPKPPRQATAKPVNAQIDLPAYVARLERKLAGLDELQARATLRRDLALWLSRYERLAYDEDAGLRTNPVSTKNCLDIVAELCRRVNEASEASNPEQRKKQCTTPPNSTVKEPKPAG